MTPCIPSDLLEPALFKWLTIFLKELGCCQECPPLKWWQAWKLRANGILRLLHICEAVHATFVFQNRVGTMFLCVPDQEFEDNIDKENARIITWSSATAACTKGQAA